MTSPKREISDLRLKQSFSDGRQASVNLTGHPHQEWSRQFLDILRQELKVTGSIKSPSRLDHYAHAFKRFGLWLTENSRALTSFTEVTPQDLDDFEAFLYHKHGYKSRHPYRITSDFIRFIRLAGEYIELPTALSDRILTNTRLGPIGDDQRREPYSDYIAERLLEAAFLQIEEARQRILVQSEQYISNAHKDKHHKSISEFLIYTKLNGPFVDKRELQKFQRRLSRSPNEHGDKPSPADLYPLLYITTIDITAFTIAISLLTGIPMESVRELAADCLANESGSYADIRYVKRRTGHDDVQAIRCPSTGTGWTGPGLIKLLQQLTSAARKVAAPSEARWLMLGYGKQTPKGYDRIRRLDIVTQDCVRFCEKYPIIGDDGNRLPSFALSRLRKTYKAKRYKTSPTTARLAGDHTPRIHDEHYANVDALKEIHERTIEEALQNALNNALNPTIIADEPAADEEIRDPESMLDDVWMAGCKDINHSPFNEPGSAELCRSPVWGCLTCKNAVISVANLPAILAFLDHVISMRQCLDLASWASRYGYAFGQITMNILPKFSPTQLANAKAIASDDGQLLWLPAELTQGW